MRIKERFISAQVCLRLGFLMALLSVGSIEGQTYTPSSWVNNPFSPNPNFGVEGANSGSPTYTNNGVYLGTLYGHSPIGTELRLERPGDTITLTGQVTFAGNLNPDGNLQFRIGLFFKGTSNSDTNWLGYMVGNPVNVGDGVPAGLYVRNNPNPGIYASGSSGNAMRPKAKSQSYTPGWSAGTYDFNLSVSQISDEAQRISWKLAGQSPITFNYSGSFTNSFEETEVRMFDTVGFLGGAALFSSAAAAPSIGLKDVSVTLAKKEDESQ